MFLYIPYCHCERSEAISSACSIVVVSTLRSRHQLFFVMDGRIKTAAGRAIHDGLSYLLFRRTENKCGPQFPYYC